MKNDQSPDCDAMAQRQSAWRLDLCRLINLGEAVGVEVMPILAEVMAHDLRVLASVNKDRATGYAMVVIQELLLAINPLASPPDVTRHRH